MGHALKVSDTITTHASTEGGRRATSAYINSVASDLRQIFQSGGVFRPWEVDAIVKSVVAVLRRDGHLSQSNLSAALHANGIPKDLSQSLADVLSR
jgi:hypothetical protein